MSSSFQNYKEKQKKNSVKPKFLCKTILWKLIDTCRYMIFFFSKCLYNDFLNMIKITKDFDFIFQLPTRPYITILPSHPSVM
jgi:hypothetical protein